MKFIFAPGARVMLRLSNERKLPLMTALFLLPLALLFYETGDQVSTAMRIWIIGGVALALYAMGSFYLQADMGWRVLIAAMERLSLGDLTGKIEGKMGGHFGLVMRVLEQINASLGEIVLQVRSSSESVALSAREIAEASANLSQRTERQATTLEQTAASIEELAATVKHNAENCKLASEQSRNSDQAARDGAGIVHGVVEAMDGIEKSSTRIAEIVGVIEGIAFQTNILALNAAVEAARAGDQGRGFAVVAAEVRALAQRSAEAAKEVRSLIERSVAQVKDGSRKAESAGRAIDEIVTGVQRGNELVGEIAGASGEQSTGVQEINRAIVQLEDVTQQNAAMVEEAAAKSVSFQAEADRLTGIVARFKINAVEAPAEPRRHAEERGRQALLPRRPALGGASAEANEEWREF
jgi:methyl-accepting chemotaxis protein